MKIKTWHGAVLITVALVAALGSWVHVKDVDTSTQKAVALLTIGLDQSKMPSEVSSYEIQRASEHFANVVLGWTIEPSFTQEWTQAVGTDYQFSAQLQEKENILLQVEGPVTSTEPAAALVDLIKTRLAEYDANTHAGYLVAMERISLVQGHTATERWAVGMVLLAILGTVVLLFAYETHASRR